MLIVSEASKGILREANHYYDINRYEAAHERFLMLLKESPESGELLYKIAFCEYNMEQRDEAIYHCRQAMEYGYITEGSYVLLGLLLRTTGFRAEAKETFMEGLSNYPSSVELRAQYGYMLWLNKQRREGQKLVDEALSMNPLHEIALYYKFHMEHGRGKESRHHRMELLRQYMDLDTSEINRLMLITTHLIENKEYFQARETCREAFILNPTDPAVVRQLDELEMICHPIFLPNRLVSRIGKTSYYIVTVFFVVLTHGAIVPILLLFGLLFGLWTRLSERMYRAIQSLHRKWG